MYVGYCLISLACSMFGTVSVRRRRCRRRHNKARQGQSAHQCTNLAGAQCHAEFTTMVSPDDAVQCVGVLTSDGRRKRKPRVLSRRRKDRMAGSMRRRDRVRGCSCIGRPRGGPALGTPCCACAIKRNSGMQRGKERKNIRDTSENPNAFSQSVWHQESSNHSRVFGFVADEERCKRNEAGCMSHPGKR